MPSHRTLVTPPDAPMSRHRGPSTSAAATASIRLTLELRWDVVHMTATRAKKDVRRLMRRVGLGDRTEQARVVLPDTIDLDDTDARDLLAEVGLPIDSDVLRHGLGGSP